MTETIWQTSLKKQGAVCDDGAIQHFGNAHDELIATANGNTLCDLSHLGLLSLSGDDAVNFLQGQVTNDVHQLDQGNAHFSGYCSPKGRMLALFLAFSHNNHLYLQFSHPLLATIMKRLKMYVMRAKVEISDVSNQMIRLGINGPDASTILAKNFSKTPTQDYALMPIALSKNEVGIVIKLPSVEEHTRYEIFVEAEHAIAVWNILKVDCKLVGKPSWDWLDIQTGLPEITEKTQEQFVPQMLNLDLLNGINFKKGCYTGQEIVARTHYLGTVKRRTYLAKIITNEQPLEGDKVLDASLSEVGQIVKIAPNLSGNYDALIEIRIEAKQTGSVSWKTFPIEFSTLPYDLKDALKNEEKA